jgi:hypothetical protein
MRDTAEAISRDTDVPVDWVRGSLEDLIRRDGLTRDQAYAEVRLAYEVTFHAFAHRAVVALGRAIRGFRPGALPARSVRVPR